MMDKRSALSCDSCRSRKLRCIRMRDGSCQKCLSQGKECTTSNTKQSRAYYQTSKTQYELLSQIVQHYMPGTGMSTEELRNAVMSIQQNQSGSDSQPRPCAQDASFIDGDAVASNDQSESSFASEVIDRESIFRDAANSPRVDVGSGWAAFLRRVYAHHDPDHPLQPAGSLDDTVDGIVPKVKIPNSLPCVTKLEAAASRFFREINSTIYILKPEAFGSIVEELYTGGRAANNASVAIVLATFALMEDSAGPWFHHACLYLDLVIAEGSLESVQAIIILVLCRLIREERHAAWVLLGSAVRIARSRGMDRSPETWVEVDIRVQETRSRVWWALYTLDTDLTFNIGAPPELNLPVDEVAVAHIPVMEHFGTFGIPSGYTAASAKLSVIIRRNAARLYSRGAPKDVTSKTMIKALDELAKWCASLPPHLNPDYPMAPEYWRAVAYLHRRYLVSRFQITRSCLLSKEHDSSAFAQECVSAHEAAVALLEECHRRGILSPRHYLDMTQVWGTGIVMLLRALKWPSVERLKAFEEWVVVLEFARHTRAGQLALFSARSFITLLRNHLQDPANSQLDAEAPALYLWTGFDPADADANFEELLQTFLAENPPLDLDSVVEPSVLKDRATEQSGSQAPSKEQ